MNTCEHNVIFQGTVQQLEALSWELETRILKDADPLYLYIDEILGLLYVNYWAPEPTVALFEKADEHFCLVWATYCDLDNDFVGQFEPQGRHRVFSPISSAPVQLRTKYRADAA
jgi:hypothetical protein